MEVQAFKEEYFKDAVELTYQHWKNHYIGYSTTFTYLICEFILRKNYYPGQVAYSIIEDNKLRGILFGHDKNAQNNALEWLDAQKSNLTVFELKTINSLAKYLSHYDDLMKNDFMGPHDCKVSLFISDLKGAGSTLLEHYTNHRKENNYNELFLWTDSSCNHEYYPKRGFTEVLAEENTILDEELSDFFTLFYKKQL